MKKRPILIVGGGLSGLHTAYELEQRGLDYLLLEARDRLGGRILSVLGEGRPADGRDPAFDLGPAWFWPGQQRMEALARRLGLEDQIFKQYSEGDALWESAPGSVRRGDFGASMAGSYRLRGGMASWIHALASHLPASRIRLGSRVTHLALEDGGVAARVATGSTFVGSRAVLALPPRLAVASFDFAPELPPDRRTELEAVPTWMAGSAKAMAFYERPFWREEGLSGDAFSQVGPLGEIHDASPAEGGPFALFGFFAVPPEVRERYRDRLSEACLDQLVRLFGDAAAEPLGDLVLQDWAYDPLTAVPEDRRGPPVHSLRGLTPTVEPGWKDRLLWSGSEAASPAERNNGYLEGALEASWRVVQRLV